MLKGLRTPSHHSQSRLAHGTRRRKIVQNPPCIPIHPFMIDHFQSRLIFSGCVVPHSSNDSVGFASGGFILCLLLTRCFSLILGSSSSRSSYSLPFQKGAKKEKRKWSKLKSERAGNLEVSPALNKRVDLLQLPVFIIPTVL
ncbi:hypothetical protein BDV38DRAFT_260466 [Aspergillus pseudotamarii]|uniref:Uncharacterized protein n=1 Tax=Aspergillus pseudotamarii TaxID=132259 RepID=A0A5N6SD80_ASPPS|nr:uncharacterized protein BDV38DRAFT_260466 [Aspergillus pseudotamarii]KAE8132678.1 hypothetical protein BDV38DRAFT_260466 [Aspergillus pseudotamarii]